MTHILNQILDDLLSDRSGPRPSDAVADVVLAACQGDQELLEVIGGASASRPSHNVHGDTDDKGAYIESVTVAGFRGIGEERMLRLNPGPGQTLVVGRNGSGKSSFAEAAEIVLTGTSRRWEGKSKVWTESWRNLHHSEPCRVSVHLSEDGVPGSTVVSTEWKPADGLAQGTKSFQRSGARKEFGRSIDWSQGLINYRPFLSYSDLGALVTGSPSALFDAMHSILGLQVIVDAQDRLKRIEKELSERASSLKAQNQRLRREASGIADERAASAEKLLSRLRPDLDALGELAAGAAAQKDSTLTALHEVVRQQLPAPDLATEIADSLDQAAIAVEQAESVATQTAERLAEILELAAAHLLESDDQTCPVCEQTTLSALWPESARKRAEDLRSTAAAATQARQARVQANRHADAFRISVPKQWPNDDALSTRLEQWHSTAAGSTQLRAYAGLYADLTASKVVAQRRIRELEDLWQPFALQLAEWVSKASEARAFESQWKGIQAALKWLKAEAQTLRDERMRPYAEASAHIWGLLRQESNVELGPIRLVGAGTNRHVSLDVAIDGVDGAALGVMSQGELHALGLSLFIPRATSPESPFRFVMIDDPVQAMDPAKVDGLAKVLSEAGNTRQVIVFTHDNRLPEAVRRLQLPATILEVVRKPGSIVEIRKNNDPVMRYLDDARAVAMTSDLPIPVRGPVVAGFCRSALESACHQRIRRETLRKGTAHEEVEQSIEALATVNEAMSLALFSDRQSGKDVFPYLKRIQPAYADAYRLCKEGVHGGEFNGHTTETLRDLINNVQAITTELVK